MCFTSKRKKGKERKKILKSIFELSKCDNLEHEGEKVIWNPIIKQKRCPLEHGCIRDHVNQFMELAQKSFSLGAQEKLTNYTLCEFSIVLFFSPEVSDQCFSHMEMFSSFTLSNGSKHSCIWLTQLQTQEKKFLLGKLSLNRAPPVFGHECQSLNTPCFSPALCLRCGSHTLPINHWCNLATYSVSF